jgi:hypothetical protein
VYIISKKGAWTLLGGKVANENGIKRIRVHKKMDKRIRYYINSNGGCRLYILCVGLRDSPATILISMQKYDMGTNDDVLFHHHVVVTSI